MLERIGSRGKPPEPPTYSRRTVFVFVDDFDLATVAGLRYARSLRPTSLRAVHFVIDNVQADKLRQDWVRANTGIALDFVDCPDRRLASAAANLVSAEAVLPGVGVTAVLPRRSYAPIVGRLLHDRTADKMAVADEPDPARRGHDRAVRRPQPGARTSRAAGGPRAPDPPRRRSRPGRPPPAQTPPAAAAGGSADGQDLAGDAAALAGRARRGRAATADADAARPRPQYDRPAPPPASRRWAR